jgi:hypothetical protein
MKGEIEKIWKNQTSDGRRYNVLLIGGERYSLWEEDYLDRLQEGQTLEFDFRESGDFKNISRIYEPMNETNRLANEPKEGLSPEYDNDKKTRKIIRMSALRSASRILAGSRIPAGERAEKTIEIARKFEKYIDDEKLADIDDDEQ